jgi:hypothetical protein
MQNQNIINISIDSSKKEKESEPKKEPEIKFDNIKLEEEPVFNLENVIEDIPIIYENEYEKILDEMKNKHNEIKKEQMLAKIEIEKIKSKENLIKYKQRKMQKDENYLKSLFTK